MQSLTEQDPVINFLAIKKNFFFLMKRNLESKKMKKCF